MKKFLMFALFFVSHQIFAQVFIDEQNGSLSRDQQKYCSNLKEDTTPPSLCFKRICKSFQDCQVESNESCQSNIECFKLGQKSCLQKFGEEKSACEKLMSGN